jgi:hypothetical protein
MTDSLMATWARAPSFVSTAPARPYLVGHTISLRTSDCGSAEVLTLRTEAWIWRGCGSGRVGAAALRVVREGDRVRVGLEDPHAEHRPEDLLPPGLRLRVAVGCRVITCPPPLNVLKDTYYRSQLLSSALR